jgi:hypothetical protein
MRQGVGWSAAGRPGVPVAWTVSVLESSVCAGVVFLARRGPAGTADTGPGGRALGGGTSGRGSVPARPSCRRVPGYRCAACELRLFCILALILQGSRYRLGQAELPSHVRHSRCSQLVRLP